MSIVVKLSAAKQRLLDAEVAAGRFASIEAALEVALDNLLPGDENDLDWTKPYLEEARAGAVQGDTRTVDDARAALVERIRAIEARR